MEHVWEHRPDLIWQKNLKKRLPLHTVETVYKHHPRWKANAMLIASYVYVQNLFYYIIDKLFLKGVGGSSFGGFKKFL